MQRTRYLDLNKPEIGVDRANIDMLNQNMNIIDTVIHTLQEASSNVTITPIATATSDTKIASFEIDGQSGYLYQPDTINSSLEVTGSITSPTGYLTDIVTGYIHGSEDTSGKIYIDDQIAHVNAYTGYFEDDLTTHDIVAQGDVTVENQLIVHGAVYFSDDSVYAKNVQAETFELYDSVSGHTSTINPVVANANTGTDQGTLTSLKVGSNLYHVPPTVSVNPVLDTGVQIASITIGSSTYELYAPTGGGSSNIRRMSILNRTGSTSTMSATGEVTS